MVTSQFHLKCIFLPLTPSSDEYIHIREREGYPHNADGYDAKIQATECISELDFVGLLLLDYLFSVLFLFSSK